MVTCVVPLTGPAAANDMVACPATLFESCPYSTTIHSEVPGSALQDLENTVGSWDMYGVEESKRYPGLQAEFFERAAAPLTRRESIVSFIAAGEPALHSIPWSHCSVWTISSCKFCGLVGKAEQHVLVRQPALPAS